MILSEQPKSNFLPIWLRWTLGLVILLALALWIFKPGEQKAYTSPDKIFCDAETVRDGNFVTGDHTFSKGDTQSDKVAYEGRYSCRVKDGEGSQFGFGYKLKDVEPGVLYRVEVWRHNSAKVPSYLTVHEDRENGLYISEGDPLMRRKDGWELLEIYFRTHEEEVSTYSIYVFSGGQRPVYFDNLLIEKVPLSEAAKEPFPELHFNIGPDGFRKIEDKRNKALASGLLVSGDDDWVSGKMHDGDPENEQAVKMRLKGDWLDHLRGKKWSFRVAMKTGGSWKGMTTFSVQRPSTRSYLMEWLLHQFWEREDVLTTRYDFVNVYLNGRELGVYAYEEHFEKQLVENKARREGPIIRFDENGMWSNIERQLRHTGGVNYGYQPEIAEYDNARIKPFNESKTLKDSLLRKQYQMAASLLDQYRTGGRKAGDVFDIDLAAKYYAISDVLCAYHGIVWHNQRYYYNPVENRLEPIGYDGFSDKVPVRTSFLGQGLSQPHKLQSGPIFASLFQDLDFVEAYVSYLEKYTRVEYLNNMLDSLNVEIIRRQLFINKAASDYRLPVPDIMERARMVRNFLFPFGEYSLTSSRDASGSIQVINHHELPVRILGYGTSGDVASMEKLDTSILLPAASPREYFNRLRADTTKFESWNEIRRMIGRDRGQHMQRMPHQINIPASAKVLYFEIPGLDSVYTSSIVKAVELLPQTPAQALFGESQIPKGEGFVLNGKEIVFPKGRTQTADNIIIPAGYRVHFEAGAELDLIGGAFFISRSPVFMAGEEGNIVYIYSSDNSAGGFTVLKADMTSRLHYAQFEGFNTLAYKGWNLTGAVTFYESNVEMEQVAFLRNHCEDGLNVIRSDVDIRNILVNETPFDGFDCDFCRGLIESSVFSNTGNDGLDVSGSNLEVRDCEWLNNGDKAVSVGEASDVAVFRSSINGAIIGMASKDRSVLVVDEVSLINCDQGFAAYQKKPEYGGGNILVKSYTAENVRRLYQVIDGSRIEFEK
ncbi:MAG: hypothetical protein GYB31_20245 [Bacteroidetes bacterium]|nr:hypothetical protein [Bacteroidota bacterium]